MLKTKIQKLHDEGLSYNKIIKELNCARSTISYHIGKPRSEKEKEKQINPKKICCCGNVKDHNANICRKCFNEKELKKSLNKTLEEYTHSQGRQKWSQVRKIAHKVMRYHNITKKCAICGFDIVVELCHIKAIKDFKPSDKMSEVNSKDNLIYLCPNHHAMLDKKLLNNIDI